MPRLFYLWYFLDRRIFNTNAPALNFVAFFMPVSFAAYQNWKYMNGCMSLLFICITMNITMTIISA